VLNGISEAEFEPIDHSEAAFDLVYLGELRSAKGVDTLIDALALLKSATADAAHPDRRLRARRGRFAGR
jgi:glycosyltransferase involved in cell wall biosynthesis